MSSETNLTLFAHVCSRPESEIDLGEAALLIAETEYPHVDVAHYLGLLDGLARAAQDAFERARVTDEASRLERLLVFLYTDVGFHGNREDYYDPRNSFLNDVLDRKTGIPITLAVVLMEVMKRAGVDAQGVSFPGHFLVRSPAKGGTLVIDPFEGRLLGVAELRALYTRATGDEREPPSRVLDSAPKRQILLRMLNNLRAIYAQRGPKERLRGVLERMQVLAPSDDVQKELDAFGGRRAWPSGKRSLN
jgi:regulator of sirC expression with transglutaminase-like and TPR domain